MATKVLSLRVDEALHEQFKQLAESQDRSINNLIVHLMKQAVAQSKATSKKDKEQR